MRSVDVVIVGASLAAAAAAKRLIDAGFETLILEKRQLPRHKICSGILSPRGQRFLIENFGEIPDKALHEPKTCTGVTFHFPSMVSMSMDFFGGPTPHLHRKYSDHWAILQSGAEVLDNTSFLKQSQDEQGVSVTARSKGGEAFEVRCKYLIGADGPVSPVLKSLYPSYHQDIPMFFVGQKFHEIIDCPLDEKYFHFWFNPDLGHYTWSHARDGRQIVGVGYKVGEKFHDRHRYVANYFKEKHGVILKPADDDHEGCSENFGPSLINRYAFGKGRVLITGQATGFLNMIGEGMSCAMHSGAIAGESVVDALLQHRPVQPIYRKNIASEVRRTTDQWNPLKIAFAKPHEADFPKALMALPRADRIKVLKDTWNFVCLYKEFKWGREITRASLERLLLGDYRQDKWM
ncbi:MAG: NAD(P)/FAD-dependent oxidoreductase [Ghiorsea sp.]